MGRTAEPLPLGDRRPVLFIHGEKAHSRYFSETAFAMLSGKWKLEIMWLLHQRLHRFGELRKGIPGITQHMLTAQLRELEADGLVSRTVFAEVPPRVEYEMTAKARGLGPTMEALTAWWEEYGKTVPEKAATRGRKSARRVK